MSVPLAKRLAAEALGTSFLLMAVVGSGIMAERLSGGNTAVALLANTLATGAALAVLIAIFGPLSGAHFNPAVTLHFVLRGGIDRRSALGYAFCQILGALCGVFVAHAMFAAPLFEISAEPRGGPSQWLSEFVATFGLLATVAGASRYRPPAIAALVGLYIAAAYWFTASTSFANPAVTMARAFTNSFSGIAPASVPGFVAMQLLAAVAAQPVLGWLFGRDDVSAAPQKGIVNRS
jgi:glycerol uptake facilitator-like aquaporin